jgi:phosphoglycolate phosphatase-like HAD superfamily hydrolase
MLVRKGMPGVRTLAVGDGANDVAMISAAHIGVSHCAVGVTCDLWPAPYLADLHPIYHYILTS